MQWTGERYGRGFADYAELWDWSVTEVEEFWAAIWEYCGVRASRPYEQVLDSLTMPGARWFAGAELNYAENMLCDRRSSSLRSSERPRPGRGRRSARLGAASSWTRSRGGAHRAGRGGGRRTACAGRRARRSRRRLHAQHPRDARRAAGRRQHRRDLVERRARVRSAQRGRPVSRRSSRRCCWRSTGTGMGARTSIAPPPCAAILAELPSVRTRCCCLTSRPRRPPPACPAACAGASCSSLAAAPARSHSSSRCRSTTLCGCSTPRARPACPRRSCTATAGS